jgi:hypothetical protein
MVAEARAMRAPWLPEATPRPRTPAWTIGAIVVGALVYIGAAAYSVDTGDARVLGAVFVVPFIVAVTGLIARSLARRDNDPGVVALVMGALSVKLLGSLVRYWTAYSVYDGSSDATVYDEAGRGLAAVFRTGDFTFEFQGRLAGTNFMKLVTGIVYTFTPATRISGFLMFAWVAFLGLLLFWRAFRLAVPTGDSRKYALLVLLLPSLVYWPSSIGKDAWMILALGMTAYGAARVATGRTTTGIVCVIAGSSLLTGIRPHVGICVFAGLAAVMLVLCLQWRKARRPIMPLVATVAFVIIGNVVVQQTKTYFGVEALTQESVVQTLDEATRRTSQGGSEFTPVRVNNPVQFPFGFATMFYRPFPTEVKNAQQFIAAMEGMVLVIATIVSWRNVAAIPRQLRASPYTAYALVFIIAFVVAFSAFSNFGLLARQRTQVLPLYLVLLAVPPIAKRQRSPRPRDDAVPVPAG